MYVGGRGRLFSSKEIMRKVESGKGFQERCRAVDRVDRDTLTIFH